MGKSNKARRRVSTQWRTTPRGCVQFLTRGVWGGGGLITLASTVSKIVGLNKPQLCLFCHWRGFNCRLALVDNQDETGITCQGKEEEGGDRKYVSISSYMEKHKNKTVASDRHCSWRRHLNMIKPHFILETQPWYFTSKQLYVAKSDTACPILCRREKYCACRSEQ